MELFEVAGAIGPIRGEARLAPNAPTGIVLCHGFKGFGRWGFFPWLADQIVTAGFNAVTFDFSGSGVGTNREAFSEPDAFARDTFSAELEDLGTVLNECGKRGWMGQHAGLFGFSRGGGIAVLTAATDRRVATLVTWSAISTVERWTEEEKREWRERGFALVENARTHQIMKVRTDVLEDAEVHAATTLDILGAAARITIPWLIVHGTADETVGVHEGRQLHTASGDRAELALVEGANHTYHAKHGMLQPTAELATAGERTLRFFKANLV